KTSRVPLRMGASYRRSLRCERSTGTLATCVDRGHGSSTTARRCSGALRCLPVAASKRKRNLPPRAKALRGEGSVAGARSRAAGGAALAPQDDGAETEGEGPAEIGRSSRRAECAAGSRAVAVAVAVAGTAGRAAEAARAGVDAALAAVGSAGTVGSARAHGSAGTRRG